jgi:hypothetical protein
MASVLVAPAARGPRARFANAMLEEEDAAGCVEAATEVAGANSEIGGSWAGNHAPDVIWSAGGADGCSDVFVF